MNQQKVQEYLREVRTRPDRASMWCYPLMGRVVSWVNQEKIIGLFSRARKNTYVGNHEHPDYYQYPYEYDSYIGRYPYEEKDRLLSKIRYLAKDPELVEAYEIYFLELDLQNV